MNFSAERLHLASVYISAANLDGHPVTDDLRESLARIKAGKQYDSKLVPTTATEKWVDGGKHGIDVPIAVGQLQNLGAVSWKITKTTCKISANIQRTGEGDGCAA